MICSWSALKVERTRVADRFDIRYESKNLRAMPRGAMRKTVEGTGLREIRSSSLDVISRYLSDIQGKMSRRQTVLRRVQGSVLSWKYKSGNCHCVDRL